MRKRSTINQLDPLRAKDLLVAYFDTITSFGVNAPYVSRKVVLDRLFNSPAPRYYVSLEEARRVIYFMEDGGSIEAVRKNPYKIALYKELYQKYLECKSCFRFRSKAVEYVIALPASSFFLSKDHLQNIIYQEIRNRRNKRKCSQQ